MSELILNATSNPGTPAAGKLGIWANSTNNRLWFTDQNGNQAPVGGSSGVYNVQDYGVYPTTNPNYSATGNVTNLGTLLTLVAPAGSQIFFPPGTYGFASAPATLTKDFAFVGVRGQTYLSVTANITGNFLTLDNTGYYTSFTGLIFNTFANLTGYFIECQNDVSPTFSDLFFEANTTNTAYGAIDFTGSQAGDLAFLHNVIVQGHSGAAINVSSPLDTLQLDNVTIIGNGSSTAYGIQMTNGGACLGADCQVIKCNVNVGLTPTSGNTVSAVKFSNSFFDQGVANSLLISGAGTVLRCTFDACWWTASSGGASPNCIQVTTTGASVHGGLEFVGCQVLNATTGSTGTLTGMNIAACSDITITGGEIAGWTSGITITPASNGSTNVNIVGANIGASGGVATNTVGITLNGGTNYAGIHIVANDLIGNTTAPLSDASTVAAGGVKNIQLNSGLNATPTGLAAPITTAFSTTETVIVSQTVPAGSVKVGTTFRVEIYGTFTNTTASTTNTITIRAGTTGTTADASIGTVTLTGGTTAGTAVPFHINMLFIVSAIGSTGAISGFFTLLPNAIGITASATPTNTPLAATATFNTTTATVLSVTGKTSATTSTFTTIPVATMEQVKL